MSHISQVYPQENIEERARGNGDLQSSHERTPKGAKQRDTMNHISQTNPIETIEERIPGNIDIQSSDERRLRDSLASGVSVSGMEHICKRDCSSRR